MQLTIDVSKLLALSTKLEAAKPKIPAALVTGVTKGGLYVEGVAKGNAPVKTGHLRRSIVSQASAMAGGAQARIGPSTPYARWVEEGRGPVVAHGKALRFSIGGQTLYRKRVGPAKGRWYMKRAFESSRGPVVRIVSAEIVQAIEGIV